jgi:hypothetical protein
MSPGYINVPVVADPDVLIQQSFINLSSKIQGWVPREGNLEVLLIEEMARVAAETATVASDVPKSIFRYYGSLINIPPFDGVKSEIKVTITLFNPAPSGGYTIATGTVAGFMYQGNTYQFQTIANVTILEGATSVAGVVMEAIEYGTAYNIAEIMQTDPVNTHLNLLNADRNISGITISSTPSTDTSINSGVDPESDAAYLTRLSRQLQLLAPRPITTGDFAELSKNSTNVYRAVAIDGFNPYSNLLSVNDSDLTNGVALAGYWSPVGGVNTPTVTQSSTGATVTMAAMTNTKLTASLTTSSQSMAVTAALNGATVTQPLPVVLRDLNGGGNEVLLIKNQSYTSPYLTPSLVTTPVYAHDYTASLQAIGNLQGITMATSFTDTTGIFTNKSYLQAGAIVKCGTDTASVAQPIIAALATYANGNSRLYSSLSRWSDFKSNGGSPASLVGTTYDYTDNTKLITVGIPSTITSAPSAAPNADSPFDNLPSPLSSVRLYILWDNATSTTTHKVLFTSLNLCDFDFGGSDSIDSATSNYNFVPDATFTGYVENSLSGWTIPSGYNVLAGTGIQYPGTGSSRGSALDATSSVFSMKPLQGSSAATGVDYTFFATFKISGFTSGLNNIAVTLIDKNTGTTVASLSTPTSVGSTVAVSSFNVSASGVKDVYAKISMGAGLNIPTNCSVVITNIGLKHNTLNAGEAVVGYSTGYAWNKGGNFVLNTFNAPRSVTVAPVSVTGISLSRSDMKNLEGYLNSYREVNFNVSVIQPNYVPINVSWSAISLPGYDTATLQNQVEAALRAYINPSKWGGGDLSPPRWDGTQTTLRIYDIASVIGGIAGIANVVSVQIATTGGTLAKNDIQLVGIAPLPVANTVTGSITPSSIDSPLKSV